LTVLGRALADEQARPGRIAPVLSHLPDALERALWSRRSRPDAARSVDWGVSTRPPGELFGLPRGRRAIRSTSGPPAASAPRLGPSSRRGGRRRPHWPSALEALRPWWRWCSSTGSVSSLMRCARGWHGRGDFHRLRPSGRRSRQATRSRRIAPTHG